jgi:hypothetical protein
LFCIDNIPIYIYGISSGDIVSVEEKRDSEGVHRFTELVRPSFNSTYRVIFSNAEEVQSTRDTLRSMGCVSEGTHKPDFIAIEIPGDVDIVPFLKLLDDGEKIGRWEYEVGAHRHPPPE